MTARQRLRRATRESLAIPAFSSPIDCTPWVTGGLWPVELSTITAETATLAEYLKADLQRIANSANDELKIIKRAGMSDFARQAEEARVIDEARARAVRRVESTVRHLHVVKAGASRSSRPHVAGPLEPDLGETQVIPAITSVRRRQFGGDGVAVASTASGIEETQVIPAVTEVAPTRDAPLEGPTGPRRRVAESGRHRALVVDTADVPVADPQHAEDDDVAQAATAPDLEETQIIPAVTQDDPTLDAPPEIPSEPRREAAESGRHHAVVIAGDHPEAPTAVEDGSALAAFPTQTQHAIAGRESDIDRLYRLLEFVVRQEPRLNWAIGDHVDGTPVLVTDLAHGWIPSGITLPAGVRLLKPERRTGRASALIGDTARIVTYAPGESLHRSADFAATKSSLQPRMLPAIEDLGRVLTEATRRRDGLPRIVRRLVEAAAAGTDVVDQEVDVLRVHLDTARYRLLVQYPNVHPAVLLDCLLLAAAESIASGYSVSANYHLAWYQKLAAPPPAGEPWV